MGIKLNVDYIVSEYVCMFGTDNGDFNSMELIFVIGEPIKLW